MSQLNHKHKQTKEQKNRLNTYARFSGLVIQMIAIIGVGTFVGIKLDEAYPNEKNLFTLACTLSGVILSIIYVIRRIIVSSKEK